MSEEMVGVGLNWKDQIRLLYFFSFTGVYNVVSVLSVQQIDSVIHIMDLFFFKILVSLRLL